MRHSTLPHAPSEAINIPSHSSRPLIREERAGKGVDGTVVVVWLLWYGCSGMARVGNVPLEHSFGLSDSSESI